MGYYTSYTLDVIHVKDAAMHEAIVQKLKERKVWGYALYGGEYNVQYHTSCFYSMDSSKWSDHDDDMEEISRSFPDATFRLTGFGDDREDMWYTLYRNGESEEVRAVITWPDPTEIEWED